LKNYISILSRLLFYDKGEWVIFFNPIHLIRQPGRLARQSVLLYFDYIKENLMLLKLKFVVISILYRTIYITFFINNSIHWSIVDIYFILLGIILYLIKILKFDSNLLLFLTFLLIKK